MKLASPFLAKKSEQQIIWYGFIKEIIYKEKFILFLLTLFIWSREIYYFTIKRNIYMKDQREIYVQIFFFITLTASKKKKIKIIC